MLCSSPNTHTLPISGPHRPFAGRLQQPDVSLVWRQERRNIDDDGPLIGCELSPDSSCPAKVFLEKVRDEAGEENSLMANVGPRKSSRSHKCDYQHRKAQTPHPSLRRIEKISLTRGSNPLIQSLCHCETTNFTPGRTINSMHPARKGAWHHCSLLPGYGRQLTSAVARMPVSSACVITPPTSVQSNGSFALA